MVFAEFSKVTVSSQVRRLNTRFPVDVAAKLELTSFHFSLTVLPQIWIDSSENKRKQTWIFRNGNAKLFLERQNLALFELVWETVFVPKIKPNKNKTVHSHKRPIRTSEKRSILFLCCDIRQIYFDLNNAQNTVNFEQLIFVLGDLVCTIWASQNRNIFALEFSFLGQKSQ